MSDPKFINDEEVNGYIDGELGAECAEMVRKALADNASLAERVALYQADKAMLKAIHAPLAERPLPPEWIIQVYRQERPRPNWRLACAIAATLLVVAGGPLVWRFYGPAKDADLVETALNAREGTPVGVGHAVTGDGPQVQHYDDVLRQAVASNLHVPDLSRMGYRLRGLRLYDKAAELVYRGPQDRLFTLYVSRSDGSARFDQFERRGIRVCIWQDDQISTVMAGNVSAPVMQRLATLSYLGLTS